MWSWDFYLFCHYKVCGKWAIFVAAVPFGLQRLILIEWASMKINACTIASLDWHRSKIQDLSSLKSISLDYWKWRQTAKKNSGFGCCADMEWYYHFPLGLWSITWTYILALASFLLCQGLHLGICWLIWISNQNQLFINDLCWLIVTLFCCSW